MCRMYIVYLSCVVGRDCKACHMYGVASYNYDDCICILISVSMDTNDYVTQMKGYV